MCIRDSCQAPAVEVVTPEARRGREIAPRRDPARLAAATREDTIRGLAFNSAFDVVREHADEATILARLAVPTRTVYCASKGAVEALTRAMALDLAKPDGTPLNSNLTDKDSSYKVRRTTGFVKSEQLQLAAVPVTSDLLAGDTELILNGLVPGLEIGQPVALTGEQADAAGVLRSEIKFLDTITHTDGFTALKFTEGLAFAYKRDTLIINANVASATHGETQLDEVLGSGDGAQPNCFLSTVAHRPLLLLAAIQDPLQEVVVLLHLACG